MQIVIAAGGTGGHLYPGIALGQAFRKIGWKVCFIGRKKGIERKILEKKNFKYYGIVGIGLKRKISFSLFTFFFELFIGFLQSLFILKKLRVQLVMGMGGYISFPVILAAKFWRLSILIHEQNFYPGLANRVISLFTEEVTVSFPQTIKFFPTGKAIYTGNPVRQEIWQLCKEKGIKNLSLERGKFTILVVGGSKGAHAVNLAVINCLTFLRSLREKIQFIHLSGKKDYSLIKKTYQKNNFQAKVFSYLETMEDAYASADLIISRAGATTLSEIIISGKPAILIPYPYATEKHQLLNAKYLQAKGAAIVVENKNLSGKLLAEITLDLVSSPQKLLFLSNNCKKIEKKQATQEIIKLIKISSR